MLFTELEFDYALVSTDEPVEVASSANIEQNNCWFIFILSFLPQTATTPFYFDLFQWRKRIDWKGN